jgi:hypothetical protein
MVTRTIRDHVEVPLHFEKLHLRGTVETGVWLTAVLLTVVGIGLAVRAASWSVEALGVCLAAVGGAAMVGVVRCRSFETVVDRRYVAGRAGPLGDRLPVGMVADSRVRPAGSWRRLYAEREVVLQTSVDDRRLVVPSHEPASLIEAIESAA